MNSYLSFKSLRSLISLHSLKSLILLAAALTFAACTQDDEQTHAPSLQISVSAQGFSPSPSENGQESKVETRVSDAGYTTTFEDGDQIGITVVNGSSILHNNVPCTYNSVGSTWTPGETILKHTGATFFAYYPYSSGNNGRLPADIVNSFTPKADQSGYAAYTASDLMTWSDSNPSGTSLEIRLAHVLSLVEVTLPTGGTGLTVSTGSGLGTPYNISGDTYRYIAKPGTVTVSGSYEQFSLPVAWKESVVLAAGEYTQIGFTSPQDCIITFDDNGGTGGPGALSKKKGEALGSLFTPTNGTAIFGGWYTTQATGWNKCTTGDLRVATSTRTFYARWYEPDANDATDLGSATPAIDGIGYVATGEEWNTIKTVIANGGNGKNYIVNTGTAAVSIGGANSTFGNASGIKVVIQGSSSGGLTLSGAGRILHIKANQSVILRGPTLTGYSSNTTSAVYIEGSNSTFTLESGSIRNNNSGSANGGGVYVGSNGSFAMSDGSITGNSGSQGGGVHATGSGASFTMSGGNITSNTANTNGGGVYIFNDAVFRLVSPADLSNLNGNTAIQNGKKVFKSNYGQFVDGSNSPITGESGNLQQNKWWD